MAGLLAVLALGFGVVLGTAISPGLAGIVAAPAPPLVAAVPPPAPPPAPAGGGGSSAPAAAAPSVAVASTTPSGSSGGGGGGGSGGGGNKKEKKEKEKAAPIIFSGTVVRANPLAQSYTVSTGSGLVAIHADALPKVGDQVEAQVRKLNNGTFAENASRSATGTADVASFQGTVTYCADLEHPATPCSTTPRPDDDRFVYAVSSLGASVLVSSPQGAALPPVGSQVQVAVKIGSASFPQIDPESPDDWTDYPAPCNPVSGEQNGVPAAPTTATELTQTSLTINPPRQSAVLEAVVQETNCDAAGNRLVLSADDVREAGRDLSPFVVPAGIDQSRLTRGEAVQVAVDIADGSLTVTGITSDQGAAAADDPSRGQGTLTGS
jgi:hypothetical protein